jgi:hypothetical protein
MKRLFSLLLACIAMAPLSTFSQDEFEYVQVLDDPRYSLTNRFHFDLELTSLPLDAYYKPLMMEGSLSYQMSDRFSWEAIRLGYPLMVHDTGLNRSVERAVDGALEEALADVNEDVTVTGFRSDTSKELRDIRYKASSTLYLNLLYSKSNWFNQQIVYHFWQVGAGPFFADMKSEKQYGVDLSARVRFFLTQNWMLNLRGGMGFGFNSKAPTQLLFFSIGGGFAL